MGNTNPASLLSGLQGFNAIQAPNSSLSSQNVAGSQISQAGAQPYNSAQQGLLGQLGQEAVGNGPNLALGQFQQANQQNIAQQAALAAGTAGNQNPGLRAQQLARNAAATNQGAALQSAQLAGQQQLAAQNALGGIAGQGINQQLGLATNQAQMNQQANLANQQANNQTNQFNVSTNSQNTQNANQNQLAANAQYNNPYGAIQANNAQASANLASNIIGGVSGLAGAGLGVMAKSDENSKEDIESGNDHVGRLLRGLSAKSYEYKDGSGAGEGPGKHLGVMAQDLERAGPEGASAVKDTADGKMVDYGQLMSTMMAALAAHQKSIDELSKKK